MLSLAPSDEWVPDKTECSFCGKAANQVKSLIAGPGVSICEGCVSLCVSALADKGVELPPPFPETA
jgi:hypothetical protein